jgi:DNA-binding beta-propeller fold protein YncE
MKILVLGTLHTKEKDREMERDELKSVQYITENKSTHFEQLSMIGGKGVVSLEVDAGSKQAYLSTDEQIYHYSYDTGLRAIKQHNWSDIHEVTMCKNKVYVPNTGRDEVVVISQDTGKVQDIVDLSEYRTNSLTIGERREKQTDTFHIAQVYQCSDGQLFGLVHHCSGVQIKKMLPNRIVKNQGSGGMININTGKSYDLGLKAPHSAIEVEDEVVIFDSANFKARIYDKRWDEVKSFDTSGFGRGADLNERTGMLYAGMSKARKRYLKYMPVDTCGKNQIDVIDTDRFDIVRSIKVTNVEQISNVYSISSDELEVVSSMNNYLAYDKNKA